MVMRLRPGVIESRWMPLALDIFCMGEKYVDKYKNVI